MKISYQSVEFIHIDALVDLVREFHICDRHPFTTATINAITELVNDDALGEAWLIYLDRHAGNLQNQHDRPDHYLDNSLIDYSDPPPSRSVNHPAQGSAQQSSDEAIGYVIVTYAFSLTELKMANLDEIYLRAPYRGQGIGKRVLEFVEDYAKSIGIKTIYLEVRRDNTPAQKLYQNMGYAEIPERYAMYKRI